MSVRPEDDNPLWRRVFPLGDEPYRYALNVRPLAPPSVTEKTHHHERELELKRAIDLDPRRRAFLELEGSRDAQGEAADLVLAERADVAPPEPGASPLHAVAMNVQEDLLVLAEDDGGALRLVAGALHFPSAWSLAEKMGQEFLRIHGPVKGFADSDVGRKSREFMSRLRAGRPVWRANWTLQAGGRLDLSPEVLEEWIGLRNEVTAGNCLDFVHLRVEYQKLFRLERTGAVLFSIHTLVVPLHEVAAAVPERGRLLAALKSLDADISRYKGLEAYLAIAVGALEG